MKVLLCSSSFSPLEFPWGEGEGRERERSGREGRREREVEEEAEWGEKRIGGRGGEEKKIEEGERDIIYIQGVPKIYAHFNN